MLAGNPCYGMDSHQSIGIPAIDRHRRPKVQRNLERSFAAENTALSYWVFLTLQRNEIVRATSQVTFIFPQHYRKLLANACSGSSRYSIGGFVQSRTPSCYRHGQEAVVLEMPQDVRSPAGIVASANCTMQCVISCAAAHSIHGTQTRSFNMISN